MSAFFAAVLGTTVMVSGAHETYAANEPSTSATSATTSESTESTATESAPADTVEDAVSEDVASENGGADEVATEDAVADDTATAEESPMVTLTLLNEPENSDGWVVGETMNFSVTVNNTGDRWYGFKPTASNLSDYTDCQWRKVDPGQSYTCSQSSTLNLFYTVTQEAADEGSFTPSITYTRYIQEDYNGEGEQLSAVFADEQTIIDATSTDDDVADSTSLETSITIIDPKDDGVPYAVGETIKFNLNVTNQTDSDKSVAVTSSNLTNFNGCKYSTINSKQSFTCTNAYYTVQQTDLTAGTFTPEVVWTMYDEVGYQGSAHVQAKTLGAEITVAKEVASLGALELTSDQKDTYTAGETLTFSVQATNQSSQNPLTFEFASSSMLTGACTPDEVQTGANATCSDLTYTLTDNDILMGITTATVVINAKDGDKIVQQLTGTLDVTTEGDWPDAEPYQPYDVDPTLETALTSLNMLASSDSENNYRIPTITVASNGDLLASYDLRPTAGGKSGGDSPNANWIVQRRSTDNGETWGPQTVIAKGNNGEADGTDREGYSDPSYVVDYTTGTIFNFHVYSQKIGVFAEKNEEGEITVQPEYVVVDGRIDEENELTMNLAVSKSTDNGYTWDSEIITNEVLLPYAERLQSCFATSGGGTQVQHGEYAGRLIQQLACVATDNTTVYALSIYSDNNGETWQAGNLTSLTEGVTDDSKQWVWDENKVVELSDGTLMLNSRTSGDASTSEATGYRIVATSTDGGENWSEYRTATDLVDPANNAMIIRAFPNAEEGTLRSKVLLFSNTNSNENRKKGTISVSYDNGETWSVKKEFRSAGTGYTSMVVQKDGSIGLLLEPSGDGWTDIAYLNMTLAYIDPELQSELKIESGSDERYQKGVDGEAINIPLKVTADDEQLDNTVEFTGLPEGLELEYDEESQSLVGTADVGNTESETYQVTMTMEEEEDGTGRPRQASYSFTFVLAPEGETADYSGRTWYVNAEEGDDENNGLSEEEPFKSLAPVNDLDLLPGDKVLLHYGDTFNDQYLHIKGSGSPEAEIEIGAYGDPEQGKPTINANGKGQWYQDYHTALDNINHVFQGTVSSAILLKDVEYVTVHNIEVTNARTDAEKAEVAFNDADLMDRTGVAVIAENAGTINNVTIENMYIHDVDGNVYNKHMANGGIYVIAHKPLNEEKTGIARFDGVNILNNRVESVRRWGIGVGYSAYTAQFDASEIPDNVAEKYGQTNVVVKGNYVEEAGGDAITVFYSLQPLVESNVSQNASTDMRTDVYTETMSADGKDRSGGRVAAAIWTWKSKDALFQYNESFNTLNSAEGNGDGQAWDADWGDGTIYQYNYSHGNTGGTVMFCGTQVMNSTFRFNISDRDLGGLIDIPDSLPEAHIYNNTFIMAENVPVLGKHTVSVAGSVAIENNIFYYTGDTAAPAAVANWTAGTGTRTWDNNLYYNFSTTPDDAHKVEVSASDNAVMVDPLSGPVRALSATAPARAHVGESGTAFEGFRLAEDSPAANTGKTITDRNGFALQADFFGTKITGAADIGAVQAEGEAPEIDIPGTSLAEWQVHNEGLADYVTLQEKLANTSETMTWLFTGDSITHGVLHTNGLKRFTEYFEDYLRTDSLGGNNRSQDVVLNTGVSSADTSWLVDDYPEAWLEDRDADVVFITFGMNDGRQDTPEVPLDEYQANLEQAISTVRAAGGVPVLMTQNYTTDATSNTNLDQYFDTVRQLAEDEDVLIVDFNRWWVEHNRGVEINTDLMNDSIHPNQQGHLYWAQLIVDTLGIEDCSRLSLATDALVDKAGQTVVLPEEPEEPEVFDEANFAGSTGVSDEDSFLTAPKKSFANAVESLSLDDEGTEGLDDFAEATEGNLTIRFKLTDDADTNTEMVLAAFGNAETGHQLTLSVQKNQMRLGRDFGTGGYGFFSFYENDAAVVNDGQFHTLSVNISEDTLQAYVDGVLVKDATLEGLNLDPERYGIDTVTLGGALEGHQPASTQNAQATIDYVQALNRALTADEVESFKTATAVADSGEADEGVTDALKALYNNTTPQMWSFLGGSTTQGTTGELSAKNYVQAFEEVLRWEHGATPEVLRMKFVQNAGLSGLNSAELLERYQAVVAEQNPDVLFIAPDVLNSGKLVETDVDSFTSNIRSIVTAAQDANSNVQIVLMTPAQLGDQVTAYAEALRNLAEETDASLVDATAWVNEVDKANDEGVVASEWFDTNQVMTAKGHVELAKFIMETIDMMPADVNSSKIWALNYDGASTDRATDAPEFEANRACPVEPEPEPSVSASVSASPSVSVSATATATPDETATSQPTDAASASPSASSSETTDPGTAGPVAPGVPSASSTSAGSGTGADGSGGPGAPGETGQPGEPSASSTVSVVPVQPNSTEPAVSGLASLTKTGAADMVRIMGIGMMLVLAGSALITRRRRSLMREL